MALWPFGRKKKKTDKLNEKAMATSTGKDQEGIPKESNQIISNANNNVNTSAMVSKTKSKAILNRRRSSSAVSSKRKTAALQDIENAEPLPPVPPLPRLRTSSPTQFNEKIPYTTIQGSSRQPLSELPPNREDIPSYYFQSPMSQSSIQPEKFSIASNIPTLRPKRTINESKLSRDKSAKRKAEELAREKEIRAMSSPIPVPKRPQSHTTGLLARESKRIPGALNRKLERPASEISLPLPESIHSSGSGTSEWHSFKISAFDALSPRPTIKYSGQSRAGGVGNSLGPSRTSTRKDKGQSIPEEEFNSRERINDLADDLDTQALRELLDRDHRRKERKQEADTAKLERKLRRKAEQQELEAREGQPARSDSEERGRLGLGLMAQDPSSTAEAGSPTEGINRDAARSPESWLEDPSKEHLPMSDPFVDPLPEAHLEEPTPEEKDEAVIETAKAVRLSAAGLSPPTSPVLQKRSPGPSHLSTLSDLAYRSSPGQEKPDPPLPQPEVRRGSDHGGRIVGSWTSIFRRSGTKAKRDSGRITPSEFSNTSRESFARQTPPPGLMRNPRARSGTPARTQSKFREDLPEMPLSPPETRMQSPSTRAASPFIDRASKIETLNSGTLSTSAPLADVHPAYRDDITRAQAQTPDPPSTALLSQSLASVDSEGSWLSGRPAKRSSQPTNPTRGSGSSLSPQIHELPSPVENAKPETAGAAYFARRRSASPGKASRGQTPGGLTTQLQTHRHRSAFVDDSDDNESPQPLPGTFPPPDDDDDDDDDEGAVTVNAVVGRHPTIVRRPEAAKSKEGLLDDFHAADAEEAQSPHSVTVESPAAEASPVAVMGKGRERTGTADSAELGHAMSVDLAGREHARHISAGSARLLDLPGRVAGEEKRRSGGSLGSVTGRGKVGEGVY